MISSNKKLVLLFGSLYLIHIFCSVTYGLKVPWGGDEWYSYHAFTVMALPFSTLVLLLKSLLGPVSLDNFIIYRQQGLLWTTLIFIFLFRFAAISKERELSKFSVYLSLFVCINPYILQTEQFFRYYQLYIAASVIVTFIILQYDPFFNKKRSFFNERFKTDNF